MEALVWFSVGGVVCIVTVTNIVLMRLNRDIKKSAEELLDESQKVVAVDRVQIPRANAIPDAELRGLLCVAESNPVLRGVLEVISRAEEATIVDYTDERKSRDERADGGVAVRAIRNLRADLLAAVEEAHRPAGKK